MTPRKMLLRIVIALAACGFPSILACAQTPKTDRDDGGLKGSVKSVTAEDARLSDGVEAGRVPSSSATYDRGGNLTQQTFHRANGKPHFTIRYGLVDGDKTSTTVYAEDASSPPPPPAPAASSKQATGGPGDPRFEAKYKYKYDGRGNRIEEARYGNRGALQVRDERKFDAEGRRVEWARYTADGELNLREVILYDAGGQVSEETYYSADGSVSSRYSYAGYQVDAKGNWVKRVKSKWVTKNGRSYFEPEMVTYRTIAYY